MASLVTASFPPIQRPVDKVVIDGKLDLTIDQYHKVLGTLQEGRRRLTLGVVLHLAGGVPAGTGFNSIHLDVSKPTPSKPRSGITATNLLIEQEWFPESRVKEVLKAVKLSDLERIHRLLLLLDTVDVVTKLTCHGVWVFRPGEAEPIIPLPFPIPLPPEVEMTTVVGLNLANNDGSQSMTIDRRPNGGLSATLHFETQGKLGTGILVNTLARGQAILAGLIRMTGGVTP